MKKENKQNKDPDYERKLRNTKILMDAVFSNKVEINSNNQINIKAKA